MNSIAVFAPLIVKSFRDLNEDEENIINEITDDLKVKSLKTKNEEIEKELTESLKKLNEERDKEIEKEKEREKEREREREREKEREREREKEKEKEELKNEMTANAPEQPPAKNATTNANSNAGNAKKAANDDTPQNTKMKKRNTKMDLMEEKSKKEDLPLKKNYSKNSLKNGNKEVSSNSISEITSESSKVYNADSPNEKLLAMNKNYKSKIDIQLIKDTDSIIELNNMPTIENTEEEVVNLKNLEEEIQQKEEKLKIQLKKKKKINSIKKLSYNDYMFVDPLQYPKSVITIERRRSIHPICCKDKHKNPLSFDLKNNISSDTSDNDKENNDDDEDNVMEEKLKKDNSKTNKNDNDNNNDNNGETSTQPDSSLPYLIPLKESNPNLIPENEENTEKVNIDNTEENDYIEANDDCNEMFLMGYPRLQDYPHKHLFQNQKFREKQRYLKTLKEKRNRNGKNNIHHKFIQTQNRTNIKLKKKYAFQENIKTPEEATYRNYHPLLHNFQLQQINAKALYQQELDKNNNKSDSLNSSINSLYREEINELSKSMVPASPSRRKHKYGLPPKESYNIDNFEKDTSNDKKKIYYDNNKKINLSSDEEEDDSSTKEFEENNFSSSSSDYYRKKTAKIRKRKLRLPVDKRVNGLLNRCTSLKRINIKSPLSKLNQHMISICKDDNETEENKLLNNIECYKIMQNKRNQKLLMQFRLRQLGVGLNYRQYLMYMKTKNENKKYNLKDLAKIQFREYKNSIKKFIKEQESKVKAPRVVQNMISSKVDEIEQNSESSDSEKQVTSEEESDENFEIERPEIREARRQLFKRIPYQEGRGYAELYNGNKYWGEFEDNLMNGLGRYEWNNGLLYEGEFSKNSINGIGKYTWKNSNSYTGNVENFVRNGYGEYINNELKKNYVGEWKNGKFNGYGILKYDPEGKSYYEGEWLDNNKHGKGKMVYASGNVYTGDWKNNLKDGFGKMEFKDKNEEYVGFWKNNLPNGKGIYIWNLDSPLNIQYPIHNQYEGDWDDGKKWGHGIFRYSSGAIYEGEWFNNMKHGIGIYITEYGYIYDGIFKYDRTTEPFDYFSNDKQHFFDLSLIYEDEKKRDEQLRSLNTIIVRYIFDLNQIYMKYRSYQPKENMIYENYSLSYLQLWKLLEDCEISKQTNYSLIDMNREYAKIFKDKNYLNYKFNKLHNENLHMTLHDFYEYLIHISYLLYGNEDIQSINEDGIAVCFSHFIKNNLLSKNVNSVISFDNENENENNNLGLHIFQTIKDKYGKVIYDMYKDRAYYHKKSLKTSKGDLTLNIRDIIYVLKDYGVLDDELLTMKMIIKIFSIYFMPGIDKDGVYNFDYELLPYEFIRFLFYCIIVKYCPNEKYIKSKRNKIYNETVTEQETKKEEVEERVPTPGNKTENVAPPVSAKPPIESKKSEASEKLSKKNTVMEIPDPSKGKSSNLTVQKKKQISNISTTETLEKPEILGKNGKKISSAISQPPEEKPDENKKVTPGAKNNGGNESPTIDAPDNSDENQKNDEASIKPNVIPPKFKFYEFHDNEEPSFIIETFMNKLLISKKEDDNDSYVKTDTTDTEDEEMPNKEQKEIVIPTIDKLDPEVQDWITEDINTLLTSFSEKLDFFKKRDENQRLAIESYNNNIIEKQLALRLQREEQMNLNRKLQNEIKNSKWVIQNLSKFNEVTNEVPESVGADISNSLNSSQQQILSQHPSQQQLSNSQQNNVTSNISLSGNKNDSKVNNNDNTTYPVINVIK